jgi:hypothetical protein
MNLVPAIRCDQEFTTFGSGDTSCIGRATNEAKVGYKPVGLRRLSDLDRLSPYAARTDIRLLFGLIRTLQSALCVATFDRIGSAPFLSTSEIGRTL